MRTLPVIQVKQLGLVGFHDAFRLQTLCRDRLLQDLSSSPQTARSSVLLLEHHPVYTVGLRTRDYGIEVENRLRSVGADFCRTDRGGLITFHGPGQLVVYPIISLKTFKIGMKDYVSRLEQSVIETCRRFKVNARTTEHTGVWVDELKIAAIGVHGSRFVTTHGLALNCSVDLRWFDHIVPCGIEGKGVTSLTEQLGRTVPVAEASEHFVSAFSDIFECTVDRNSAEQAAVS